MLRLLVGQLLELGPAQIVEVGCGDGALLDLLRSASASAESVELDDALAAEARERGHDVMTGGGCQLLDPLTHELRKDASCDWVVLRSVIHVAEDPEGLLIEAWRVAKMGVAVVEPWCDPSDPGQEAMATLVEERRAHRPGLHRSFATVPELLALMPESSDSVHVRHEALRTAAPASELEKWCGGSTTAEAIAGRFPHVTWPEQQTLTIYKGPAATKDGADLPTKVETVTLEPIGKEDFGDLRRVALRPYQRHFVAEAIPSMSQALVC